MRTTTFKFKVSDRLECACATQKNELEMTQRLTLYFIKVSLRTLDSHTFVSVNVRQFGYYILFRACQNQGNHCEAIATFGTQLIINNTISLHHAISILVAWKMAEAD